MDLNEQKLDSLLSNSFVLDFIQINLVQQKERDPVIYSGAGSIYQKDDGFLHLKLYHVFKDVKEIMPDLGHIVPGKIIGKDFYFSLEAIDMFGHKWTARDIQIRTGFSLPAAGKVVEATVAKMESEEARHESSNRSSAFLFLLIPGKYTIPCNQWEDLPRGGKSLTTFKFKIGSIDVTIKDRKNCLTLKASDPTGSMNSNFERRLIEGLNIALGCLCPIVYSSFAKDATRIASLRSVPSAYPNNRIVSPIKHSAPWDCRYFKEFLEKYTLTFTSENQPFYGYWHKINRAWQGGIENAALAITTAIEGISKNYYNDYGMPDSEIITQAEEAKKIIKTLHIGDRIRNRILSNLGQVNSSNPKSVLYNLSKDGKLDESLVDGWVSLRNKSTHADDLDEDIHELQKYIDQVYVCMNLFNMLLLIHIKYTGKFQDLSQQGWVENSLILDSEAQE